jgi:hypothetical protein
MYEIVSRFPPFKLRVIANGDTQVFTATSNGRVTHYTSQAKWCGRGFPCTPFQDGLRRHVAMFNIVNMPINIVNGRVVFPSEISTL